MKIEKKQDGQFYIIDDATINKIKCTVSASNSHLADLAGILRKHDQWLADNEIAINKQTAISIAGEGVNFIVGIVRDNTYKQIKDFIRVPSSQQRLIREAVDAIPAALVSALEEWYDNKPHFETYHPREEEYSFKGGKLSISPAFVARCEDALTVPITSEQMQVMDAIRQAVELLRGINGKGFMLSDSFIFNYATKMVIPIKGIVSVLLGDVLNPAGYIDLTDENVLEEMFRHTCLTKEQAEERAQWEKAMNADRPSRYIPEPMAEETPTRPEPEVLDADVDLVFDER